MKTAYLYLVRPSNPFLIIISDEICVLSFTGVAYKIVSWCKRNMTNKAPTTHTPTSCDLKINCVNKCVQ